MKLNTAQNELHQKALEICRDYDKQAWRVIEILQELDEAKLYKYFGCSSLFVYAVKFLQLDESVAYPMINAARKALEIPQLNCSLKEQRLSLAKAVRILSTVDVGNAEDLVAFAETHTADEINREVSRIRKREGLPAKLRNVKVTDEVYAKIKRAQSILAKSGKGKVEPNEALDHALEELLERHDPVRKAKRAVERREKRSDREKLTGYENSVQGRNQHMTTSDTKLCTYRVSGRKTLTAAEKHEVIARDGGQCTHRDSQGRRCGNDRFLHIHHIQPVSHGGTNDPNNLTTLCSFHHDQAHQLTFPIEGQITWLRDRIIPYRAL